MSAHDDKARIHFRGMIDNASGDIALFVGMNMNFNRYLLKSHSFRDFLQIFLRFGDIGQMLRSMHGGGSVFLNDMQ